MPSSVVRCVAVPTRPSSRGRRVAAREGLARGARADDAAGKRRRSSLTRTATNGDGVAGEGASRPNARRAATRRVVLTSAPAGLIALAASSSSPARAAVAPDWGYADAANNPLRWGQLRDDAGALAYPECGCAACQQSPIDLPSVAAKQSDARVGALGDFLTPPSGPVTFAVSQKHGAPNYVVTSTGGASPPAVVVDGITHALSSLHFHTPGENTIDGAASSMEMHLVHLSEDGDVAVVGVLLSRATEARRANGEVSKLLKRVDADGGKKRVKVDMSSLLDYDSGFWRWQGSLTTPPCSGGVRWFLQREISAVEWKQREAFKHHVGSFPGNARPTQPLNGRSVLVYRPA